MNKRFLSFAFVAAFLASGATQVVNTVAVGNVTGLGTGVATALAIAVGTAGSVVTNGGAGGALKSKVISGTRDLSLASGNVSYTGMGFTPTSCLAMGGVAGSISQYVSIIGMADSARTSAAVDVDAALIVFGTNFMTFGNTAGTGYNNATILSYDADGLTLAWTKIGSPSGTASFSILCFR